VLPDTLGEVGGDAHVQRSVSLAREEVDARPPSWVPAFAGATLVLQKVVPPRCDAAFMSFRAPLMSFRAPPFHTGAHHVILAPPSFHTGAHYVILAPPSSFWHLPVFPHPLVFPAKAGIQAHHTARGRTSRRILRLWVPAYTGTNKGTPLSWCPLSIKTKKWTPPPSPVLPPGWQGVPLPSIIGRYLPPKRA
jgi:hypothetical protein